MPDFSGPELCERIRGDSQRLYTYIIVLTSISEKDNVVKGLAAGADDYLTKPFDPGELLARIGVGRRTIGLHREIDAKNKLLDELAHTDSLTGLPNRRAIEEWAAHADLDNFKCINDNYGHDAGDQVLQKFGEVLRENTRASDISGRMGGDEFLLVMTHLDEKSTRLTVERLRTRFAALKFSFGGDVVSVTASFGIAGFQGKEPPDFSRLVKQADKALYSGKRAGRNQVTIESH
jgi:diguanylate cyclase (GGDEF)-like protein